LKSPSAAAVTTAAQNIRSCAQLQNARSTSYCRWRFFVLEVNAIMEDDDPLRFDAPLCPTCKNPMELGRVKVEGYPYVPSFECWPCLEVFTEANERT
jgi:hypothetical protein